MVELKINGELVETGEEVVISYNYDLYSDVLSNFTTSYTNAIDLPMTSTNKKVFGYPNITYGDIGYYTFELYKDGVLYDTGSVLVDHVTDDVISINLFSQLITKGEELAGIENFAACLSKDSSDRDIVRIPYYDSETGKWGWVGKLLAGEITKNVSSLVDDTEDDGLYYEDTNLRTTSGYMYLATANIGKPKALNCDSYYDANAETKIKQWPEGGERTFLQTLYDNEWDSYAIQTRFYDLQPIMPVDVLFLNLFRNKGITISQGVHRLFNGYDIGVAGAYQKMYITLPSLRDFLDGKQYESTTVSPTSATTASTVFSGVYPVDGEFKLRDLLNTDADNWGTLKGSTKRIAIQCMTISAQHAEETPITSSYLIYTDGAWKYAKGSPDSLVKTWYRNLSVKKLQRKDLYDREFVLSGLTDGLDYTVTVTCTGVYQVNYSSHEPSNGQVYVDRILQTVPDHTWHALGGICTTSGEKTTFTLRDYFKDIKEPWKLAVDICKHFNLRFKYTSPSTMELCLGNAVESNIVLGVGLGGGYYEVPSEEYEAEVIDDYLDWSDFKIVPQVFENKSVLFKPEFNGTSWDKYVVDNFVYPYGTRVESTNYPIKSEEEWFDWNVLKHLSTYGKWKFVLPPIPNHYISSKEEMVYDVSQAFDENYDQVSIPYSLCTDRVTSEMMPPVEYYPTTYICNEMQTSDFCYYGQTYLTDYMVPNHNAIAINHMPFVTTLEDGDCEKFLFGDRIVPAGVRIGGLKKKGLGDVLDQMNSSKLVLKVFLDKMNIGLYDFIRKMYLIEGSVYIVGAVHSYAIGSGKSCEVEFIKVQELNNYKIAAVIFPTVTFSCEHGSVGATVDGIGIQSGSLVQIGKTVVFTITPDEGYEYLGTNPESVIVLNDVVKNYECTEVVEYVTLNATAVNGSISATVGGNPVQLPYTAAVGTSVVLRALPNEHYHFTNWDDGEIMNPRTFVMLADETLSTTCALDVHTVTLNITNGTGVGGGTFNYGTTTQISVTPDSGYRFVEWADGNTDNPRTITVTGDVTYSSACVVSAYAVNFSCANGSVGATVDGIGIQSGDSVEYGKTVIFTITPDEGYEYTGTNPESVVVSGAVTKDYVCTVIPVYHTISFSCVHGSVGATVDGVGIQSGEVVLHGKTVVFTITPDSGYEYTGTNPESVVVSGDVTRNYVCTEAPAWTGLKFTSTGDSTISFNQNGTWSGTWPIEISTNGSTWTSYTLGTVISLDDSDYVCFRGQKDSTAQTGSGYRNFVMTGSIAASGDCTSLLNGVGGVSDLTTYGNYTFYRMFAQCTALTSAPSLPATTLAEYCYQNMFADCTGLTSTPSLPATTLAERCYGGMFIRCTSLVSAPELPATTLAILCYSSMFNGCTNLVNVPSTLPATTLASSCYAYMFYECSSLTTAPSLLATTLASYCCDRMFNSCTSLTSAPDLPVTTLESNCYECMFSNCTSLTSAPDLPATILANNCYQYMFYNCTSLTSAPSLPATTLAEGCYDSMFYCCTSLTSAPELPATTLAILCYRSMFGGCTSLTTAPSLPATTLASSCYSSMFYGCTSLTGPVNISATSPYYEGTSSACRVMFTNSGTAEGAGGIINVGGNVDLWNSTNTGISSTYWTVMNPFRMTAVGNAVVSFNQIGTYAGTWPIQYSTDGNTWISYTMGDEFQLTDGQTLYWKGQKDSTSQSSSEYRQFAIQGGVTFGGNIMSLIDGVGSSTSLANYGNYTFHKLFAGCSGITSMPDLGEIATLTTSCYESMFEGCTSLVTAMSELPATTLQPSCYYGMFQNCSSLVNAPILPAHTLTDSCYAFMFDGCTDLETIHIATDDISVSQCTLSWVRGVTEGGDFYTSNPDMWEYGEHGVPVGWEIHEEQFELPEENSENI